MRAGTLPDLTFDRCAFGQSRSITPDAFAALRETMHVGTVLPAWRQDKRHAGMLLRHLREAAGLTQLELRAAAGLSHEAISMLETGKRWPQAETVRAPARALRGAPERFNSRQPVGLSMMTMAEAASRLDVSFSRIQSWLKQGILPGTKVSGQWRVSGIAVDELARGGWLSGHSGRLDRCYRN